MEDGLMLSSRYIKLGVFAYLISSVCITGLFLISDVFQNRMDSTVNLNLQRVRINQPSYTQHARIRIYGNDEFNTTAYTEGWSGNGTKENPYIIEDYFIDVAGGSINGITIRDTNVYFIIRNCYVTGAYYYPYYGIAIFNVTNGLITRNICTNNSMGIGVTGNPPLYSVNNTVSDNNCSYNRDLGIYLTYAHYNLIANNTCNHDVDYGILVVNDGSNTLRNNTCMHNTEGIYVLNCNNNVLENNTCNYNTNRGIYVYNADNTRVADSKLCYNTATGVLVEYSDNHQITGNLCVNNTRHIHIYHYGGYPITDNTCINGSDGITLRLVSGATIVSNNTCIDNAGSGIYLWDSDYHTVINNTLIGNNYGINLRDPRYVDVLNNTLESNTVGIYSNNGDINLLKDNKLQDNTDAIILYGNSNSNDIVNNTISHPTDSCLRIEASVGNNITNNTFDGGEYGIHIDDASYANTITWNAFFDSTTNAFDNGTPNAFDYNFWSDHVFDDINNDGIVDSIYFIPGFGGNNDTHPLMLPPDSPPTWLDTPSDVLWGPGGVFTYDLNATALPPGIVSWRVNDTAFTIDSIGIITNVTGISDGFYPLQVWANDSLGEEITSVFTIIVDTLPPYWIELPSDQYAEFGSRFIYDLHATDLVEIDLWWISDITNFYITQEGVLHNATQLAVDIYEVQVWVNDTAGKVLTGSFTITVEDRTDPSWLEQPSNQVTELGASFNYHLNAIDLSGIALWSINDTIHFSIDENGLVSNVMFLSVGTYWLEVRAFDPYGNNCTGIFRVVCVDTSLPTWATQPTDKSVEYGDNLMFQLDAVDLDGIQYYWLNDTDHFSVDSEGLVTNATFLSVGIYCLEVAAFDPSLNNCTATMIIVVSDTTSPKWTEEPSDQIMEYGNEFYYDLNATDLSKPLDWQVDDTLRFSVDWQGRVRSVVLLSPGSYGFRVYVRDLYGNLQTAFLTVSVQDTTPPNWIVVPTSQTILSGQDFDYQLKAEDLSGIEHWILNDTINFSIDNNGRIVSNQILDLGVYNLNVTIIDSFDNARSIVFSVIVLEFTPTTSTISTTETGIITTTSATTTYTETQPTTSTHSVLPTLVEFDRTFVIMMLAGLGGAVALNVVLLILYRRALRSGKEG